MSKSRFTQRISAAAVVFAAGTAFAQQTATVDFELVGDGSGGTTIQADAMGTPAPIDIAGQGTNDVNVAARSGLTAAERAVFQVINPVDNQMTNYFTGGFGNFMFGEEDIYEFTVDGAATLAWSDNGTDPGFGAESIYFLGVTTGIDLFEVTFVGGLVGNANGTGFDDPQTVDFDFNFFGGGDRPFPIPLAGFYVPGVTYYFIVDEFSNGVVGFPIPGNEGGIFGDPYDFTLNWTEFVLADGGTTTAAADLDLGPLGLDSQSFIFVDTLNSNVDGLPLPTPLDNTFVRYVDQDGDPDDDDGNGSTVVPQGNGSSVYEFNDIIFSFSLTEPASIALTNNEGFDPDAAEGNVGFNHDHFVLTTLDFDANRDIFADFTPTTGSGVTGTVATQCEDEVFERGSFRSDAGAFPANQTLYFVIDSLPPNPDADPPITEAIADVTLEIVAPVPPRSIDCADPAENCIDIDATFNGGMASVPSNAPFELFTCNSDADTHIAIFDSNGELIRFNESYPPCAIADDPMASIEDQIFEDRAGFRQGLFPNTTYTIAIAGSDQELGDQQGETPFGGVGLNGIDFGEAGFEPFVYDLSVDDDGKTNAVDFEFTGTLAGIDGGDNITGSLSQNQRQAFTFTTTDDGFVTPLDPDAAPDDNIFGMGVVGRAEFPRANLTVDFFENTTAFDRFEENFPTQTLFAVMDISFCDGTLDILGVDGMGNPIPNNLKQQIPGPDGLPDIIDSEDDFLLDPNDPTSTVQAPMDSEMAIWANVDGALLDQIDDRCDAILDPRPDLVGGGTNFFSNAVPGQFLSYPLPAGDYTVSLSGWETVYRDGFIADVDQDCVLDPTCVDPDFSAAFLPEGSEDGEWTLTVADTINGDIGVQTLSDLVLIDEVDFITFTIEEAAGGCNRADLAAPFNILNASDINAFVSAFLAGEADLNGDMVTNSSDINAFVADFLGGCP